MYRQRSARAPLRIHLWGATVRKTDSVSDETTVKCQCQMGFCGDFNNDINQLSPNGNSDLLV